MGGIIGKFRGCFSGNERGVIGDDGDYRINDLKGNERYEFEKGKVDN